MAARGVQTDFSMDTKPARREMTMLMRELVKSKEELRKVGAEANRLQKKLEDIGRRGKDASEQGSKGFDNMLASVKRLAGGLVGVGGVLKAYRLITAEIEKQQRLQKEAADAHVTLASAQRDVIRNMPGASPEVIKAALAEIRALASELNISEKALDIAAAAGLSASGGNVGATMAALRGGGRFLADKPDEIARFVGSLLDLQKVTGVFDAEANLGLLAAVGGRSRVVDPMQQGRNIPPALINQLAYGSTPQGAAALFAALTTETADITGERSGTAVISLTRQLRDFFERPEEALPQAAKPALADVSDDLTDKARRDALEAAEQEQARAYQAAVAQRESLVAAIPQGLSTSARIEFLQANPEFANLFLANASFEGKAAGAIERMLLESQSGPARAYAENLRSFPPMDQMAAEGRKAIENLKLAPAAPIAELTRIFDSAIEQAQTETGGPATASVVREGLKRMLDQVGQQGVLGEKIEAIRYEIATGLGRNDPVGYSIRRLQQEEERLTTPGRPLLIPMTMPGRSLLIPTGSRNRTDMALKRQGEDYRFYPRRTPATPEESAGEMLRQLADELGSFQSRYGDSTSIEKHLQDISNNTAQPAGALSSDSGPGNR